MFPGVHNLEKCRDNKKKVDGKLNGDILTHQRPTRSYQHCARTSGTGAAGKSESGKFFSSVSLQRLSLQTICGIGWGGRMDICQGPFKEHQAVLIIIVETFQALESKGRPLLILVTC